MLQLLQIMSNTEKDFVDVPKEATNVGPEAMLLEGPLNSRIFTRSKEVHTETINSELTNVSFLFLL